MSVKYLAIIDVDQIQSYIFATDRLREIAGASSLLDNINRIEIDKLFHRIQSGRDNKAKLLVNGGGVSKAIFTQEESADAFACEGSALYARMTLAATATWIVEKFDSGHFKSANDMAETKLKELKASKGIEPERQSFKEIALVSSPFLRRCTICGVRPAFKKRKREKSEEYEYPCHACDAKALARKKDIAQAESEDGSFKGIHQEIREALGHFVEDDVKVEDFIPDDFEDLVINKGKQGLPYDNLMGTEKSFIGLIVADGNSIGEHIKKYMNSAEKMESFSSAIERLTRKALIESVKQCYRDYVGGALAGLHKLPLRVLLLGGDDLMVVTPGELALPLAKNLCRHFENFSKEAEFRDALQIPHGYFLTLSAGVAIGKVKHPFFDFVHLADGLLASAKEKGRQCAIERKWPVSAIDFSAIRWSGRTSLERFRKRLLELSSEQMTFRLTAKPYTLEEFEAFTNAVTLLKKVPHSKLAGLAKICGRFSLLGQMEDHAQEWMGKIKSNDPGLLAGIAQVLPDGKLWNQSLVSQKMETRVLDAMELLDFWPDQT